MKLNKHLVTECYNRDYKEYSKANDLEGVFSEIAINEYNIMDKNNNYTESKANNYIIRIITEDHEDN